MSQIEQTFIINATPEEVWQALTDPEVIAQWSGAPAVFSPEAGAEYSLWNGDIKGRVLEVAPMERLVKTWEPSSWNVVNSVVTFVIAPDEAGTRVDLIHQNVEEWDHAATNEGWDIYYLGAIKRLLDTRNAPKAIRQPSKARKSASKKSSAKKSVSRKGAAKKAATKGRTASKKAAAKKRR